MINFGSLRSFEKQQSSILNDDDRNTIILSRNKDRKEIETLTLYSNIHSYVIRSKEGDNEAQTILFILFIPYLVNVSVLIYKNIAKYHPSIDIKDIFQQSYIVFTQLIGKFDETIGTSFPRYLTISLYPSLGRWCAKELEYLQKTSVRMVANSQAIDKLYSKNDSVLDYIIAEDLLEEIEIALESQKKKAKSLSVLKVCDEFIFGNKTIPRIAKDIGVSYHAVYDVYLRLIDIIASIINHNRNCAYYISLDLKDHNTYKILDRKELHKPLTKYKYCSSCGKMFIVKKSHIKKGYFICSLCGSKSKIN